MTPETILNKYNVESMGPTSDLITALKEYASLREQEIAAAAWDACNVYHQSVVNYTLDRSSEQFPNKEEYLKSLK